MANTPRNALPVPGQDVLVDGEPGYFVTRVTLDKDGNAIIEVAKAEVNKERQN